MFRVLLDLYAKGEPADPITVAAELTRTGEIGRVGGPGYLHQLVQAVPTAANAGYYAEIVREAAVYRALVTIGTQITQMGYAREGDPEDVRDKAEALLHSLGRNASGEKPYKSLGEILELTLDDLESDETGVPTGLTDLDSLTNGLQSGQLTAKSRSPAVLTAGGRPRNMPGTHRVTAVGSSPPVARPVLQPSRHRHRGADLGHSESVMSDGFRRTLFG